jgi:tRNA pseudouridine55 synthase
VPSSLTLPTGEMLQRPPAFSAVKVGGERLYKKARRGEAVEGEPRPITVHRFEQLWRDGDRVGLELEVSSGTYVRQLVADLGDAYCEELERTAVGPFELPEEEKFVPLAGALSFMPEQRLGKEDAAKASHGLAVEGSAAGETRLTFEGTLLAIARPEGELLKPFVVFPTP